MNPKRMQWLVTCLFIFLVGLTVWRQEGMFSRDGAVFLGLAELVKDGEFLKALEHPHHPLTFTLIGSLWKQGFDPIIMGRLLSICSLGFILWSVHYLIRQKFSEEAAHWSVIWLLLSPHLLGFSTDILSDPLYWGCLTAGVAFLVKAFNENKLTYSLFSGLLFSLSYLARPEGFVMACFLLSALFILCLMKKIPFKLISIFLVGLLFGMSFYIAALHEISGEWRLSRKVNFVQLFQLDHLISAKTSGKEVLQVPGVPGEEFGDFFENKSTYQKIELFMSEQIGSFLECLWYPQALILMVAFPYLLRHWRSLNVFLIFGFFQLMIVQFQWIDDHYLSKRHWMLVAICFGASLGPAWVYLKNKIPQKLSLAFVLVAGIIAIEKEGKFFSSRETQRKHLKVAYKEMGEKLKPRTAQYIIGRDLRTAWFAGNKTYIRWLQKGDPVVFLQDVEKLLFGRDFLILVPLRRTHVEVTFEEIEQYLIGVGYQEVERTELEVAFELKR